MKSLEDFKIHSSAISEFKQTIDWLGLMQHYDSSTPLMDWTTSLNIGLFFSTDINNQYDYSKQGLSTLFTYDYNNEFTSLDKINAGVDAKIKNKDENVTDGEKDENVKFFVASRIHKRLDSQKSVFSYHPSNEKEALLRNRKPQPNDIHNKPLHIGRNKQISREKQLDTR